MKKIKMQIHNLREIYRLKHKFQVHNGSIEKPLMVKNSQFVEIHDNCRIKRDARIECYDIFCGQNLKPRLVIRENVIIGYRFSALVADHLEIGANTILASDILISTENHGMDPQSDLPYHKQPLSTAPVVIGHGCWIAEKVVILPGVHIGNKCVIAAGAVVASDIPDYSIAAGVPAKVIKRFDAESGEWRKV